MMYKALAQLLSPLESMENHRRGNRPTYCEFYWLHFATADERFYPREGEELFSKRGLVSQQLIRVPSGARRRTQHG